VVEPAADQRRDRDDEEAVSDELVIASRSLGKGRDDDVRDGQAHGVREAIPLHGEGPDAEGDGIGREVQHPARV
jgi:hypothetical protein